MRKLRLILAMLTVAVLPVIVSASPAQANHDFDNGRWNHAPAVAWDGNYAGNIQDAAYYWQDRKFDGYIPPLPGWNHGGANCATFYPGYINVCTVPRYVVEAYCGGVCNGHTRVRFNWPNDIIDAFVLIADDLYPGLRQSTWRHEMGHAIGLGHVASWETNCVMHPNANVLGETCQHDLNAMELMYPGKRF